MHVRIDQVIDNVVVTYFYDYKTKDWRDSYGLKVNSREKIDKLMQIANDDSRIKVKPAIKTLSDVKSELKRQLKIEHKARTKTRNKSKNSFLQGILKRHIK